MKMAPVNKVIHSSLVDGVGNRCAVFLQGCNISCKYCHNPETQRLCDNCGICVEACIYGALKKTQEQVIWEHELCRECDGCITSCPNCSSPRVREMTVDEVVGEVKKGIPFIRGITVSGGECCLYLPFIYELFAECRKLGLTCFLDTNGTIPLKGEAVLDVCDGVMLDVKAWDKRLFRQLTGGDNDTVIENLENLAKENKLEEIRIVCIKPFVDAERVIRESVRFLPEEVRRKVVLKLIRFRGIGVRGGWRGYAPPEYAYMEELMGLAIQMGYGNVRIVS